MVVFRGPSVKNWKFCIIDHSALKFGIFYIVKNNLKYFKETFKPIDKILKLESSSFSI